MAFSWIRSQAASVLPVLGIALALANWNAKPAAAWAWTAAIGMFLVMVAVRQGFQFAFRRSSKVTQYMKHGLGDTDSDFRQDADVVKAGLARTLATVNNGVVFGALMMIIPLAMTLAHAYGLADDPTGGRRASMIICGAYLMLMGNAMPRALPPVTSKPRLDALIQAFHRRAGWTWVLCGLAFLTASLALPIKTAGPVSMALVGAATIATIVQILRLARQTRRHAPGLN
jgi:uncharacterized membrane protein